jgi:spermidine synthase
MLPALEFIYVLLISALVAFCSMGYELLIARFLSSISSDAVVSQSITVGTFLLSLGFGAYLYGRRKRDPWKLLLWVEIAVALIACVALPLMAYASIYIHNTMTLIFTMQVVSILIGTLSGLELPALIEAGRPASAKSFGWVLASNYIGSLIASITLPLVFIPNLGIYTAGWVLALFSALAASMAFLRRFNFKPQLAYPLIALTIALPPWLNSKRDAFEQFYLKSYYYMAPSSLGVKQLQDTLKAHGSVPDVIRYSTPYQEIDIVAEDLEMFGGHWLNAFHIFIDQRNQFGTKTERIYHDSMVHGAINLAKEIPKDVLIIGGGDGLIARELLKYPEIKSIHLVELDPMMIELANNYVPLRDINGRALQNPRVSVETADGFAWLRKSTRKFDAIFVDLPHPVSVDLSRLYSLEFYSFVRARLSDQGFLIFDFPFDGLLKTASADGHDNKTVSAILNAVEAAGFKSRQAL